MFALKIVASSRSSGPLPSWRNYFRERVERSATIDELAVEYIEEVMSRRDRSRLDRRSVVTAFAVAFGPMLAEDLTPQHVEAFNAAKVAAGRAGKTVTKDHSLVCTFLDWCVRTGAATSNPARQICKKTLPANKARDPNRARLEVPSVRDATRLLYDVRIPFERRLLYATTYTFGLRIGETGGVDVGAIAEAAPLRDLVLSQQWLTKHFELGPPKADDPRHIPVPGYFEADFLAPREVWFRDTYGRASRHTDPIAPYYKPWRQVCRWNQGTALDWLRKDLVMLGIPVPAAGPQRMHALRYALATHLAGAGADRHAIQAITHSTNAHERERTSVGLYIIQYWPFICAERSKLVLDAVARKEAETPSQLGLFGGAR